MTYRISKYNPDYKVNGVYTKEEWTDYSDIGTVFDGELLTEQEYLKTEQRYILCVSDILESVITDSLTVQGLEYYDKVQWKENDTLQLRDIQKIICDCLRNKCWCRLEKEDVFIHFGYDFYIYINCELEYSTVYKICSKHKLFCEEILQSPYQQN